MSSASAETVNIDLEYDIMSTNLFDGILSDFTICTAPARLSATVTQPGLSHTKTCLAPFAPFSVFRWSRNVMGGRRRRRPRSRKRKTNFPRLHSWKHVYYSRSNPWTSSTATETFSTSSSWLAVFDKREFRSIFGFCKFTRINCSVIFNP